MATSPSETLRTMLLEQQEKADSQLLLLDQEILGMQETLRSKFNLRVELQEIQAQIVSAVDAVAKNQRFLDKLSEQQPAEEGEA